MDGGLWRDEKRFDSRPCGGCADLPAPQSVGSRKNLKKIKKTVDKYKKIWYNIIKKSKEAKETKTYEEHLV